ncbi:MAG: hypothetical protein ACXW2T_06290 [Allosphingosinicella sp.]
MKIGLGSTLLRGAMTITQRLAGRISMARQYLRGRTEIGASRTAGPMRSYLLGPMLMVGLAACNPDPEIGNTANRSAQANAAVPAEAQAGAAPSAKAGETSAPLVLEGNGLRLVERDGGGTSLAFDVPKADAIQALTRAFGRPPGERGTNEECGGGRQDFAEWKGEIIVWFAEGRFVGWDSKGDLKTADGLGIGSRRSSMRQFQVEESSLGTEFTGESGLYGLLESTAPNARVTALWGGSTCIFR